MHRVAEIPEILLSPPICFAILIYLSLDGGRGFTWTQERQ